MTKETLTIPVKYHSDIEHLEKIKIGDWVDLRVAEDVFVPRNEYVEISLGVSMKLPDGYEAHIVPRSSTFKKYGVIQTNGMGIIDNSYSGTNDIWKFPAYCLKPNGVGNHPKDGFITWGSHIQKGDRICQFRIVKKQPQLEFESVEFLDDTDRGGFGSTGVN